MAEPVQIKFEYQNPENVEAEVPGAQKLREPQFESETGEILSNEAREESPTNGESTKKNEENPENGEIVPHSETESGEVVTRHDRRRVFSGKRNGIHGEPVMLDKLEDKKSKTKIPISRFRQTVEKVKQERREAKKEYESHIPVRRSSIPKPVKENKIPPTTVKKEIIITKTLTKTNSTEPVITKTIVTEETSEPNIIEKRVETTVTKTETVIEPEDEFDKIYAEIVSNTPTEIVMDESLLNPKVEDPEKLESKFEEIIHDYDEHKVESIDVEVVRRSKLPLLKRRSQQETELNAQAERTSKIIAARDKLRLRHSMNKDENFEEALDKELKKEQVNIDTCDDGKKSENSQKASPKVDVKTETETQHEVITSPNFKTEITKQSTKTVSTSLENEQENVASSSVVKTTTIKEVSTNDSNDKKQNKHHYITEENIIKGSIQIGIPVFDSYTHEYSEKNETAKTTEVKTVLSYLSKNEELSIRKNETSVLDTNTHEINVLSTKEATNVAETINEIETKSENVDSNFKHQEFKSNYIVESVDSINIGKQKTVEPIKEKETKLDEDIQLRSKVENLINKIDSREVIETERNQRESINELKKKKSVLSKIAMFERKPEDQIPNKAPKKETKLPKLITKEWQTVEHVHVHTPLIVEEVFKSFSADIHLNDTGNKNDVSLTNDTTTIVRAESVTVTSPDTVHYAAENKIQIENKITKEEATEVYPTPTIETINKKTTERIISQTNVESVNDSSFTSNFASPRPKTEKFTFKKDVVNPTNLRISRGFSYTNDIATPKINADKFEFREERNKGLSPTRLSITKELQPPVVIPGFKPISELLRSFESKQETNTNSIKRTVSKVEQKTVIDTPIKALEIAQITPTENQSLSTQISHAGIVNSEVYDDFEIVNDYKSLDDVFSRDIDQIKLKLRQEEDLKRAKSLAELDLGDAVKGKVNNMILRMKSVDRTELERREVINKKELPRKRSVSEKIALFEGKVTPSRGEPPITLRVFKHTMPTEAETEQKITSRTAHNVKADISKSSRLEIQREKSVADVAANNDVEESNKNNDEEYIKSKIEELSDAKTKYGKVDNLPEIRLANGMKMPAIALGTALLDPRLIYHIVTAAIDLGYRAIDTAFIYGNEKEVGEAIKAKIDDGTVRREELCIISKLWSTFHRTDLVEGACRTSLEVMGLDYFDLFLIHNPMSFKEGGAPIPKIATVLQYSEADYLDAWYGMELVLGKGLARGIGVSNFNSVQIQRVLERGRAKPVVNQVECHPYLTQQRLDQFCTERNVTLSCFGVLGSKGTPPELKNDQPAVVDDALVKVMASGLGITPGQLLISYQLENHRNVVVKASSARHLYENLLASRVHITTAQVDALNALNRNKRMFIFKGMGDTHRNYPFNVLF